jgi:hypothetical protein
MGMVGEAGIEPTTPGLEGRCSIQLSYSPHGELEVQNLELHCSEPLLPIAKLDDSVWPHACGQTPDPHAIAARKMLHVEQIRALASSFGPKMLHVEQFDSRQTVRSSELLHVEHFDPQFRRSVRSP